MRKKDFSLLMENLWIREKMTVKTTNRRMGWLVVLPIGIFAWLLSRAFFLQVVTGERNQVLAEGNRIEVRRIAAERGVIVDRFGSILARNSLIGEKVVREYPLGEAGVHVVGFVGVVTEEEIKECLLCFDSGDLVGKMGIEKLFDREIRGKNGEELVEVTAMGERERVVAKKQGAVKKAITLTIDGELQKTIGRILGDYEIEKGKVRGAIVVNKVATGEIVGLVSWPTFDPNVFSGLPSAGRYKSPVEVLEDLEDKPMFNRSMGGGFPPGSIFKLVTAVAGLEERKIDEGMLIEDTGELKVGIYRYGSWYFDQYGRTEGAINVVKALGRSNDIFFYKTGEMVGVDKLVEWSKKLGLGQKTGLSWPAETAGLVSTPLEREKRTGERWFLGNTYHMAIGQGDVLTSPAQIARMVSAVVSGKLCALKLIPDKETRCQEVGIRQKTREIVWQGMKAACSSGGTAFPFFGFTPPVICKTGTAQHGGEKTLPHAWITVVVPRVTESGEYTLADYEQGVLITVLLEEAGEGSYEAGPVAVKIARYVAERGY